MFPITPILAIGGSLFVIVSEIMSDLPGVLTSFIFVAVGIPVFYYETKKYRESQAAAAKEESLDNEN